MTIRNLFPLTGCLLVVFATFARGEILGFGNFSHFSVQQNDSATPPSISAGTIKLTNHAGGEARSIFYTVPQSISEFCSSFTYQAAAGSSVFDFCPSAAFVIQNSPLGATAVGNSGLTFGYSGINHSIAISLQLSGVGSGSGLFMNGMVGGGAVTTRPVNMVLGNPVDVSIEYHNGLLVETLTDTVTHATFNTTYLINIPQVIGSNTAYVGFTAATDNDTTQDQFISNFHYKSVPEASTVTLLSIASCVSIAGYLMRRRSVVDELL